MGNLKKYKNSIIFAAYLFFLCLTLLLPINLSNATEPKSETFKALVGSWYGERKQKDNIIRRSYVTTDMNGNITIIFKYYKNQKLIYTSIEKGKWSALDNIYSTKILSVDGKLETFFEKYRVIKLTKDKFVYQCTRTGNVFTLWRVVEGVGV